MLQGSHWKRPLRDWRAGGQSVAPLLPAKSAEANKSVSMSVVGDLMIAADVAVVLGSSYAAFLIWLFHDPYSNWSDYAVVSVLGTLLSVNVFHAAGLYKYDVLRNLGLSVWRTAVGWCLVAAVLISFSYFTKTSAFYSRFWAGAWWGLATVMLLGVRVLVHARIRRWAAAGLLCRRLAIVGNGAPVRRLLRQLARRVDPRLRIVGMFSDVAGSTSTSEGGLAVAGDLDALEGRIRNHAVDTVVIAVPWSDETRLLRILERLSEFPVDVQLCPVGLEFTMSRLQVSYLGSVPMLTVFSRPFSDWRRIVKTLEDRILAAIILALISPIMLTLAILVKATSRGPVLFRQRRYGFNNQLIEVLKFRTMYEQLSDPKGAQLTQRNDPRITPVGRFLRRWSLDELPQFINVLRGDMSIVGPRPHAISAKAAGRLYQDAVDHYAARHRVKPGITGWAQINGWRGETESLEQIRKRVEHDLAYIDNWSLWLDLRIILATTFRGFRGENAF